MTPTSDESGHYFGLVATFDVQGASDAVIRLLDEGMSMSRIVTEVLAPAQLRVGQLWESGRWSVADEHVATSVNEAALSALIRAATPRQGAFSHHVALACVEGEWHGLPARMAAGVAAGSGEVRVTMLGPSMPAEQLRRRLSAGDIDVLALSCTMPTNLVGAARCIAVAHELEVPVVVGGQAFGHNAHRAVAVGADRWATDAGVLRGPLPDLVGESSEIAAEVLLLDAPDESVIALTCDRIVDAFPQLSGTRRPQPARIREDLGWMARSAAGALLTDDASIVEDLLLWQCGQLSEAAPASLITTSARLLADALEPHAVSGADLLRGAAARVDARSPESDFGG